MSEDSRLSKVEQYFLDLAPLGFLPVQHEKIPVVTVDNYVVLGQITALRFLEWVCHNPGGVVALPTGKTPEFFIKWMQHYLDNWNSEVKSGLLGKLGFKKRPEIPSLTFVMLDEFFPISPEHERSFNYFVRRFYIEGFGFDAKKAMLIDTFNIDKARKQIVGDIDNLEQVFPDGIIDLTLRTKHPANMREELQKKTIKMFDQFCEDYEEKLRSLGGIGFFLGGIGPDGHVAFNVKGSSHHSHTRLTKINYETQAAASSDLGGIESVKKKAVITIGLQTITFNRDCVAIIIAAGEAKAKVVADALQKESSLDFPASALCKLPNARFFLTAGATTRLAERSVQLLKKQKTVSVQVVEKLVINGAMGKGASLTDIARSRAQAPMEWQLAGELTGSDKATLARQATLSLTNKIERGLNLPKNQIFLHTAPHHDDIELAYFPILHHLVRSEHNQNHFCYCTSGFTAVTNSYVLHLLNGLDRTISNGTLFKQIPQKNVSQWDQAQDDITGYLNGIAHQSDEIQSLFLSSRLARYIFKHLHTNDLNTLKNFVIKQIALLKTLEPGRPDPESIQNIKSWVREFEAELVWAHFGIGMENVRHLRLKFYTSDIFPQYPDYKGDVLPFKKLLDEVKPTIVTLALDPEGSGPDTHFKTLIALSQAIDEYVKEQGIPDIRIWGYRNVWSRFHPADVNMIVPVSLNSFAVLHSMFKSCFLSQISAEFPSFEFDGPFNQLAQKIWVEQHNQLVSMLGHESFYDAQKQMLRRSYGAIYIKDMTYQEFNEVIKSIKLLLLSKQGIKERK